MELKSPDFQHEQRLCANKVEPLYPGDRTSHETSLLTEQHEKTAVADKEEKLKSVKNSTTMKILDDAIESEDSGLGSVIDPVHRLKQGLETSSGLSTPSGKSATNFEMNNFDYSPQETVRESVLPRTPLSRGSKVISINHRGGGDGVELRRNSLDNVDPSVQKNDAGDSGISRDDNSYFGSSESVNCSSPRKTKGKRSHTLRKVSSQPSLDDDGQERAQPVAMHGSSVQELPLINGTTTLHITQTTTASQSLLDSLPTVSTSPRTVRRGSGGDKESVASVPRILPPLKTDTKRLVSGQPLKNDKSTLQPLMPITPKKEKPSGTPKQSKQSLLPIIPTHVACSRSYLLGNLDSTTASLLGAAELDRYFPNRKLQVFVASWNVNGKISIETLNAVLLPREVENLPDMYVVGIQEASPHRHEWEVKLQETIGPSHILFHSVAFGSLHLAVLLKRDLMWFCSAPEDAVVHTRVGTTYKTKGAVAISFRFFGTSLLFINSHLTAHDHKLKERILDYEKIITGVNLPRLLSLKPHQYSHDVTERFDCVLWCGDLNFRIIQERMTLLTLIDWINQQVEPNFEDLLREDQLCKKMSEGAAFKGFSEGRVNFMPTYKYDIGTNNFDTSSKLRIPSYTDRILYRSKQKNAISCVLYNSAQKITISDHKPVYGLYELDLVPGREDVPLAAGRFNRSVFLEALKRRASSMNPLSKPKNNMCSSVCSVM